MKHNTPNPLHDSDDQRKLRAYGDELSKKIQEDGYGGVIILSSMDSTAWSVAIPPWSGLKRDVLSGGLRLELKIRKDNPELQRIADATIGHLADMRDVATEIAAVFAAMFAQVEKQLNDKGTTIDHKPVGSPGKVGPTGNLTS